MLVYVHLYLSPRASDLSARDLGDAARAARDPPETRASVSARYGEAEPMSVAAPAVRSGHPPGEGEDALERALSDVAGLRADLARRVAAAASDAVADAGETDRDREDGEDGEGEDGDPDPSASVDQLVTRLRALHGARDACVSQMRLEGAVREAEAAASALEALSPDALVESPAEALDSLEAGVEALRAAARALAADRDEDAVDDGAESFARRASRRAPPKAPRFARVAARRIHALAAGALRRHAVALFANAAASSGWPCDFDQSALARFEWALAGDETVDVENALRRSFAACATLRAVAAAAAETESDCSPHAHVPEADARGVLLPSPSLSWVGEALASPVAANLRRLFRPEETEAIEKRNGNENGNANPLADPSRPELLFACAARSIARLTPLVCATLESLDAFGEERRVTSALEARRASVRFAETVAAAAAAAAAAKYLPACAAAEAAAASSARGGVFSVSMRLKTNGGANDDSASRDEAARLDVPWLHLADECASFDAAVAATIRETRGSDDSRDDDQSASQRCAYYAGLPAACSSFARMASTDRAWCERWLEAELGDAARALAAVCDAPADAGWVPVPVGLGLGDEAGDADASAAAVGDPRVDDVPVALPAADAACEALRRATARALALPADARVARDGLGDLVGRFYGETRDDAPNAPNAPNGKEPSSAEISAEISAREAFLGSVAYPLADAFARKCAERCAEYAGAGNAAGNATYGQSVAGRSACAATRVASFLRASAESAEALAGFGPSLTFADQIAALETCADRCTDALVDAAFGAYAVSCAPYERDAHLASFANVPEASDDEARRSRRGGGDEKGSALFGAPAETLLNNIAGLRRALQHSDALRVNAATRTVGRLAARRFLRDVVLATRAFSEAGAARFGADVDALLFVFQRFLRRPAACLAEALEAAALLTLDVREAAKVAAACGAAEAAAAREAESDPGSGAAAPRRGEAGAPSSAAAVAARAAAAEAREAVGVYALDDAVAFAVLSRRVDLGAESGGR